MCFLKFLLLFLKSFCYHLFDNRIIDVRNYYQEAKRNLKSQLKDLNGIKWFNKEEVISRINDNYKDLSATLGKAKKTIGYIFYEVPKNAKEITLEYSTDMWTDGNNIEFIIQ